MVLGAIVLALSIFLVFSYFRNLKVGQTLDTNGDGKVTMETYTVSQGDTLWDISERYYGTGYKWQQIADANAISDSNVISEGSQLVIPTLDEEKQPETQIVIDDTKDTQVDQVLTIDTADYTVVKGDTLWDISVRAYGDGYKWVEIAKANNLTNPDLIHPGNQFILPGK